MMDRSYQFMDTVFSYLEDCKVNHEIEIRWHCGDPDCPLDIHRAVLILYTDEDGKFHCDIDTERTNIATFRESG